MSWLLFPDAEEQTHLILLPVPACLPGTAIDLPVEETLHRTATNGGVDIMMMERRSIADTTMMENEGTTDIAVTARVESIASRENIANIGAIGVIANMESTVTATASQRLLPACMQDLLIRIILIDSTDTVLGDTLVLLRLSLHLRRRSQRTLKLPLL